MLQDLRLALRSLLKTKLFSLLAILTFGLGVGANTATFSVLKSISLNPLPYRDADRLVILAQNDGHTPHPLSLSVAAVDDWRMRSLSFEGFSTWEDFAVRPLANNRADFIRGLSVDHEFFDILGIKMHLGRNFTTADDNPAMPDTLILSYGLWQSKFAGDPNVIGRTVPTLDHKPFTIIGVLPANFHPLHMSNPGEIPQLYRPRKYDRIDRICAECGQGRVIGRLKPDVTYQAARAELNRLIHDFEHEFPGSYPQNASVLLTPLRENLLGSFDTSLLILFAAVGLLLVLACANVANLLLVRSTSRRTELAIRASLGANRWNLIRYMLTESLLLALAGGLFGIACAFLATKLIGALSAAEIPRVDEVGPDLSILFWGLTLSGVTGLLAGLLPAVEASRLDLRSILQGGTNAAGNRSIIACFRP